MTHDCSNFKGVVEQRQELKPEQHVLDEIEALVNEELTHTPDDYSKNNERYVKCDLCHHNWHGLPNGYCPGPYASEKPEPEVLGSDWVELGFMSSEGITSGLALPSLPVDRSGFECDLYTFDEAHARLEFHPEIAVSQHDYTYIPIDDTP